MKKTRFTEAQIVAAIKQQESGTTVKDISRELGIGEATFYNWKAKYGGMDMSEVKRSKDLEAELAQYKKEMPNETTAALSRSPSSRPSKASGDRDCG